jgi:hypothetical protein
MNQLRDLLHNAGIAPMTGSYAEDDCFLVKKPANTPQEYSLVGAESVFHVDGDYSQFPQWLGVAVRQTLMEKYVLAKKSHGPRQ